MRGQAFGQHAGNVLQQAAASDVCQRLDAAAAAFFHRVRRQRGQHGFDVQARGLHQGLAKRLAVQRCRQRARPFGARNALAHQAEAVGMCATGCQAQHHVARAHLGAVKNFRFFHCADGKTRQVVFAGRVHARHLGRLAADQRAARELAAAGDAAHHGSGGVHIELAAGEIVQEEQRFGALDQHVVDAHGHQIDAHRVVHVPFKSQLELGAHTVGAAHQHRLLVAFGHFKQGAKAANSRQNAFPHGFFGQRLDAVHQRVTEGDVHPRVLVGNGCAGVGWRGGAHGGR